MENGDTIINLRTEKIYTIENLGKHQYASIRDIITKDVHSVTLAALSKSFKKYYPKENKCGNSEETKKESRL